ncbi:MAG TPA: hypothetical protein VMY39_02740, partial [Planctomycetota bacterium]|nr:hypothetical protein [Planctomycetota bacterium]
MSENACLFCGQQAKGTDPLVTVGHDILFPEYVCNQCGQYKIDEGLAGRLPKLKDDTCFRIACVLNEKRLHGVTGTVCIFDDQMKEAE